MGKKSPLSLPGMPGASSERSLLNPLGLPSPPALPGMPGFGQQDQSQQAQPTDYNSSAPPMGQPGMQMPMPMQSQYGPGRKAGAQPPQYGGANPYQQDAWRNVETF